MKKHLLLAALCAACGSAAYAQTPATAETLTEGWYTIKLTVASSTQTTNAPNCVGVSMKAIEAGTFPYNQYGSYGISYSAADEAITSANWVYVTPNANKTAIKIVPADGFYMQSAGGTAPAAADIAITFESDGVKFSSNLGLFANFNATNKTGANIFGASTAYAENRWEITPATPAGTIYKVNITNDRNYTDIAMLDKNYIVCYNNDAYTGIKNVHNGGFYFIEGDHEPTAADFTLGVIDDENDAEHFLCNNITVNITDAPDGAAYTRVINVVVGNDAYTANEITKNMPRPEMQLARIAAKYKILGMTGPADFAQSYARAVGGETINYDDIVSLNNAITYNNQALPEDGKAYAFVNLHKKGFRYFNISAAPALQNPAPLLGQTATFPKSAAFICHTTNADENKYIFANDCGQYLMWLGSGDNTNDGTDGLTADVTAAYNYIIVNPVTSASGQYWVNGKRGASSQSVFVLNQNGGFDRAGFNGDFDTDTYCSRFALVEVEYPNTVTFAPVAATAAAEGETVDMTYATLHLPFPVSLPEGQDIHAVVATGLDHTNGTVELEEIAKDGIIPANTPVVLIKRNSTATEAITFAPAATTGTAVSVENLLAGHTGTAPEGTHYAFDATTANFMSAAEEKPAYQALLTVPAEGASASYALNVPAEISTSISEITAKSAPANVIYDLQGRRVNAASKGIFIVNGKKTLIK